MTTEQVPTPLCENCEGEYLECSACGVRVDYVTVDASLIATATRLGRELGKAEGRKQALTEIANELSLADPWQWTDTRYRYVDVQIDKETWRLLKEHASQPQEATQEPLMAHGGHSGLPEAGRPGRIRIPRGEG